jgi:hypothetical protein
MYTSEKIDAIVPAFLKAQAEMTAARKDSKNPHFRSSYADFNSVASAVKEPLNNNGLMFVQPIETIDEKLYVSTVIFHTSGQWFKSSTPIKIADKDSQNPQKLGSAITYARRYDLQSLCGLEAEDDDGNAATPPKGAYQPKPKPQTTPKRLTEEKILNFQKGVKAGKTEEVEKYLKAYAVSTEERNRIFNA